MVFCDMDTALREYPDLVKPHFGKVIPMNDNKFAALNTSVWSGGSFIYVPPGVEVEMPLQAYFRINAENMGQFERTLIIADEGSKVHYIEGCSAPVYTSDSLHSAVVEIVVRPSAHVTYTTIQNWSSNVFNLVTKRARVEAEGHMEWIDGNIGSRLTMKYPAVYMVGPKATGEVLSVAYAGPGQHQDTGAKMVHAAPETSSKIVSKSISKDGGRSSYRGLVRVEDDARGCKSHVQCDALILDDESISDTYPYMEIGALDAQIGHEATVSKVADEQLFYLMSRGLSEEQAIGMVVNGFIEPVTRTPPDGVRGRVEPAHRAADGGLGRVGPRPNPTPVRVTVPPRARTPEGRRLSRRPSLRSESNVGGSGAIIAPDPPNVGASVAEAASRPGRCREPCRPGRRPGRPPRPPCLPCRPGSCRRAPWPAGLRPRPSRRDPWPCRRVPSGLSLLVVVVGDPRSGPPDEYDGYAARLSRGAGGRWARSPTMTNR